MMSGASSEREPDVVKPELREARNEGADVINLSTRGVRVESRASPSSHGEDRFGLVLKVLERRQ